METKVARPTHSVGVPSGPQFARPSQKASPMSRIQLPRLSRIAIAAAASAALIGTTFIAPATAFAAPAPANAVAATTTATNDVAAVSPAIYNNPAGNQDPVVAKGMAVTVQLEAYTTADGTGTPTLSNTASTRYQGRANGDSIIDPTVTKSLYQVMTIKNNSGAPFNVQEYMTTPNNYKAYYANGFIASKVLASGFDENGLKSSLVTVDGSYTNSNIAYVGKSFADYTATNSIADLPRLDLTGTLAAGSSVTIRVPLSVPQGEQADNRFTFGDWSYSIAGLNPEITVRFSPELKRSDGSSTVPFTGQFLSVTPVPGGNQEYTTVPVMQKYMPTAVNGENYWVNNFSAPIVHNPTTENVFYKWGYYMVDPLQIKAAVDTHGYAQIVDGTGKPAIQFLYRAQNATATITDPSGNPVPSVPNRTAPYVSVRQVVTGNGTHDLDDNNSISVDYGSTFDAKTNKALDLKVFDVKGAAVDLSSPTVTIDQSKVNTKTPGTYPVTVTYDPDAAQGTPGINNDVVSNTFYVTVASLTTTPVPPTQSGDTVTIPTVTGVDYQVDGKTVTGTVTVPDGQTITVTATPQANYTFTDGSDTSWNFSYDVPTTPAPTPGESGSATPGEGAGGQGGAGQGATGSEVKTSGTGSASDLAGIGLALAAAGAGAAAAARKIRRNRR